jgi:hypothetical protein
MIRILGLIMAILAQTARWAGAEITPQEPQENAWVAPGVHRQWVLEMRARQAEEMAKEKATKYDQPHFIYDPTNVMNSQPFVSVRLRSRGFTATSGLTATSETQLQDDAKKRAAAMAKAAAAAAKAAQATPQKVYSTTTHLWTDITHGQ